MLLDEVGTFLQDNAQGTLGTDLFLFEMPPEAPDVAVAVIETGGLAPEFTHSDPARQVYERPTFQVVSRDPNSETARSKAETIYRLLGSVINATLSGVSYLRIFPTQSPFRLPKDENRRAVVVCNYEAFKKVA